MINVQNFIKEFKEKKIVNSKINDHAVSDFLKEKLEIKTYIPFRTKREIVEMVVKQNITEVNGIKKHDSINGYVSFVVAMISMHTALEFSEDPIADYDLLAESGLLPQIITEFKESYDECQVLLNLCIQNELEDNNINVIVAKFLYGILDRLDGVGEMLKSIDLKDILGANFNEEDLAKLSSLLNKYNK